jgi:AbrB family looped-hinge helix DNA binding protein
METTRLSSKDQIIIPKTIRDTHRWHTGQEFIAIDTEDGILLKPKQPFQKTQLQDVAGCLYYQGKAKTLEELDDALAQGIQEQWQ